MRGLSREPSFCLEGDESQQEEPVGVFLAPVVEKYCQVLSDDDVNVLFEAFAEYDAKRDEHAGGNGRAKEQPAMVARRRIQDMRVSVSKLPALVEACGLSAGPDPNSFTADRITATLYWDSLLPENSGGKMPKLGTIHNLPLLPPPFAASL